MPLDGSYRTLRFIISYLKTTKKKTEKHVFCDDSATLSLFFHQFIMMDAYRIFPTIPASLVSLNIRTIKLTRKHFVTPILYADKRKLKDIFPNLPCTFSHSRKHINQLTKPLHPCKQMETDSYCVSRVPLAHIRF